MARTEGRFAGFTDYRYGDTSVARLAGPPPKPIIENGQAFAAIVAATAGILGTATWSKFQHEGACRHGLRRAFVIGGYGWARADREAGRIVRAGLSAIGAIRPTWEQGQREYTVGPDYCGHCGGPIDAAGLISGRRYCSAECAKASYGYLDRRSIDETSAVEWRARYLFKRELNPARACDHCGRAFRPAVDGARYCSTRCSRLARGDLVPDRQCDHCGKKYHPPTVTVPSRYCSRECSSAAATTRPTLHCSVCGMPFRRKRSGQTTCSRACSRIEPGKHPERPCAHCGTPFRPKVLAAKFCSSKCRTSAGHLLEAQRAAGARDPTPA